MRIWAVALNTFKETIRNRVMVNILLFAVALIFVSVVVGDWSIHQQVKILKDLGLAAMSIFGLLIDDRLPADWQILSFLAISMVVMPSFRCTQKHKRLRASTVCGDLPNAVT